MPPAHRVFPWLAGLALAALPLLPALWGQLPVNGDDLEFGLAFTTGFHHQVALIGSEWFGLEQEMGGFPVVAEGQMAFFHPLRWLTLLLPPWPSPGDPIGMAHEYLLTLLLASALGLWGMRRLARRLGAPPLAAWVPAILYTGFGFHLSQASNLNMLLASCLLPWAALFWLAYARRAGARPARAPACLARLALAVGAMALAGQPQVVVIALLTLGLFVLIHPAPRPLRGIPAAGGAVAAGLVVGAVQWWPTLALAAVSERGGLVYGTQGGLTLASFARGMVPLAGGSPVGDVAAFDPIASAYLSSLWPAALVLALAGAGAGRLAGRYLGAGALCALLATGPGYGLLTMALPHLGAFRDVHRLLLGTLFFLCLAWAKWLGSGLPRLRPAPAGAAVAGGIALLALALGPSSLTAGALASLAGLSAALALAIRLRGAPLAWGLLALLLVETAAGLPARWQARFLPYRPAAEVAAIPAEDCPSLRSVWYLDTYRESLKQESIDAGNPLAAYLGSPNGHLWDDPLFANCPGVVRYQVNSPLRPRWQAAMDDNFIPAFGLSGYTASDLMALNEVWAPAPLPGAPPPEAVAVAGREWWRHSRPRPTKSYAHYTGPATEAWVVDEGNEAEGLAALTWVLTGDIWARLPLTAQAGPDTIPVGRWWSPGWSGGRVAYAFVAAGATYRLPGLPYTWLSALAALPLLSCGLGRRRKAAPSDRD